MKKIAWIILCIAPVLTWADNIKMVTYFPVPYMNYQSLNVAQKDDAGGICTVGLLNKCEMETGQEFLVNGNMHVTKDLQLKFSPTATDKKLDVHNFIAGGNAGSQPSGDVYLRFLHDVTLSNVSPGSNGSFTLKANSISNLKELRIETLQNGSTIRLPVGTGSAECNQNMSWRKLTIDGQEGLYLTCGERVTPKCKATVSNVTVMTSTHTDAEHRYVYNSKDSCDNNHQTEFWLSNMNDVPSSYCEMKTCTDYFNREEYEHWDLEDSGEYFYYLQGDRTGIYGGTGISSNYQPYWEEGKQCEYIYYGIHGPGAELIDCPSSILDGDGGYVYTHHHDSAIDVCNALFDKRVAMAESPCWDGVHGDGMYNDRWCVYKLVCRSFAAEKKRVWTFEYEGID